jgi:hypothetical protein
MNEEAIVVAHWDNGAYVNSYHPDYDELYAGLVADFGLPCIVLCDMRPIH